MADHDAAIVRIQTQVDALAAELRAQGVDNAVIKERMAALVEDIAILTADQERRYVPMSRFAPVEKVVYGLVGAVLLTALYAVLSVIIPVGGVPVP